MENLELYERVRSVPDEAKKTILAGRLKNMTDINPMWRIKKLTEEFGVCGIGWRPQIVKRWLDEGSNGEVTANMEILLFVKVDGQWSEGIPGVGGSKFVAQEAKGLYTDDECYKKAYTDALSVACKALGIGADVYFAKDNTKYDKDDDGKQPQPPTGEPQNTPKKTKFAILTELIKDTEIQLASVNEWIAKKFGKSIPINKLTDEQFKTVMNALKKQLGVE